MTNAHFTPSPRRGSLSRFMRFQTLYEGRWIFAVIIALGVAGVVMSWLWLAVLAALLAVFCTNFFRDPERAVPPGDDVVGAAADGGVADILYIDENEALNPRSRRL